MTVTWPFPVKVNNSKLLMLSRAKLAVSPMPREMVSSTAPLMDLTWRFSSSDALDVKVHLKSLVDAEVTRSSTSAAAAIWSLIRFIVGL